MQEEMFLTTINALLYAPLLIYTYNKYKSFNQVVLIAFVWFLSAFFSIFYIQSDIKWISIHKTTFIPFLYLIGVFWLTFWPLIKIRSVRIVIDESKFINKVCLFVAFVAIIPFMENFVQIFMSGNSLVSISNNYENRDAVNFDARAHMSFIGSKLNSILLFFQYITPILFFNYLSSKNKKSLLILIGLICAILNTIIFSFNLGARGVMVNMSLYVLFLFLLYKNYIEKKYLKFLLIVGSGLSVVLVFVFLYISIGRFGDSSYNLIDWIYRYAGESFINFNNDMFYIDNYTYGQNSFSTILSDEPRNIDKLANTTGIRAYVFYTYIGDFYMDFGPFGTILIIVILSLIFFHFARSKKQFNIGCVLIYSLYSMIMLLSTNCFYYINGLVYAFFSLIVGLWYSQKLQRK